MSWLASLSFFFFLLFFHGDDNDKNLLLLLHTFASPKICSLKGCDEDKYKADASMFL